MRDKPNDLRSCLAQAPQYKQISDGIHEELERLREDVDVRKLRFKKRADLVMLIEKYYSLCGEA